MAASSKKKAVSKDDLRRLMKEKRTGTTSKKKIDSPLAKYNSLGQLSCVLCNTPIKNELLWNAHLQGRTHKENVAQLKAKKERETMPAPPPSTVKRKGTETENQGKPAKIAKSGLPADFFDNGAKSSQKTEKQPKSILKNPKSILKNSTQKKEQQTNKLGIGDYEDSSSEDEETKRAPAPPPSEGGDVKATGLPSDFFDQGVKPSAPVEESPTGAPSMAEKLPEGFFDDPKKDAKVRQVEYKDKMDEEWELFQKSMKEETQVSEAILEEDEEAATAVRSIDEIDDQLHRWKKVDTLQKKKEEIMAKESTKMETNSDSDSVVDEQEFEEFLDWRSKKAWKS